VLTPAREDLIRRTVQSVEGCKNVIIHMYNATSPLFREVVFRNSKQQTIELAVHHTKLIRELTDEVAARTGGRFRYEYSPETFSQTEPDFPIELCDAVKEAWGHAGPGHDERIIFNLPATVEIGPPNHYADLVSIHLRSMDAVDSRDDRSRTFATTYRSERRSSSVYILTTTEVCYFCHALLRLLMAIRDCYRRC
jgi:2-isopropylmalate synthase